MINTLKKLFGIGPGVNYAELVKDGAIILDVRSKVNLLADTSREP